MIILSLIQFIAIVGIIFKKCRTMWDKIEISHIFCFSIGYIFYCIVPIWFFVYVENIDDLAYDRLREIFLSIPEEKTVGYLIISFLFYISYMCGVLSAKRYKVSIGGRSVFKDRHFDFNKIQNMAFLPVLLLGVILVYKNRTSIGTGYTGENWASSTLSAYEYLLNSFILMFICTNTESAKYKMLILNKWQIWFVIYSCLLLSTGGRLYVVTSILSQVVFFSCIKTRGFKIRKLGIAFIFAFFSVGAIGMLRAGGSGFKIRDMIINVFLESIFTNWSAVTYIKDYPLINFVGSMAVTISAFVNMIPSAVFPGKLSFMTAIGDIFPLSEAPLGASHFFLNFNGGLGTMASLLFFFAIGRWLERLHNHISEKEVGSKVMYCFVSANTLFSLFRDPISVSVVKNILEFSVFIPWIFIYFGNKLTVRKGVQVYVEQKDEVSLRAPNNQYFEN